MSKRIHILGAAGSGTTTLGKALADAYELPFFDSDDYYWLSTDPPYREKRPVEKRLGRLAAALPKSTGWIISGSLAGWGDPLIPLFDLAVFLKTPKHVRIARLRQREADRYGVAIDPDGTMHAQHEAFIAWAAGYEEGTMPGRSLQRHEEWLEKLPCPVLCLDGTALVEDLLQSIHEKLGHPKC